MKWEWDTDKNIIDDLCIPFFGKKIGILGHDDGGKTVLIHLIKEKELKPSSGSTDAPDPKRAIKVTFDDHKGYPGSVLIKVIIDTPGDKAKIDAQKKVLKGQDYIIYFLRSDLILAHNKSISVTEDINRQRASAKNSLKQYLSNFQAWIKDDFLWEKNRKFIFVGNHFAQRSDGKLVFPIEDGKISEFFVPNFLDREIKAEYSRDFKRTISDISERMNVQLPSNLYFVVGSLASEKLANQLVLSIFRNLI